MGSSARSKGHGDAAGDGGCSSDFAFAICCACAAEVNAVLGRRRARIRSRITRLPTARRLVLHSALHAFPIPRPGIGTHLNPRITVRRCGRLANAFTRDVRALRIAGTRLTLAGNTSRCGSALAIRGAQAFNAGILGRIAEGRQPTAIAIAGALHASIGGCVTSGRSPGTIAIFGALNAEISCCVARGLGCWAIGILSALNAGECAEVARWGERRAIAVSHATNAGVGGQVARWFCRGAITVFNALNAGFGGLVAHGLCSGAIRTAR